MVVPLVALIFGLLFLIWYGWNKFSHMRRNLRKEIGESEEALHKAFDLLKEDIREQIKMLEKVKSKRKLTLKEEEIIKLFRKHLNDAERFVGKEIGDIRKEIL